jgi:type I restriction enzyme S subunit
MKWTEQLPEKWKAVPLRAAADFTVSNVDKIPADDELPVRLCNYTDIYNNEFITAGMEFMRGTATPSEIKKFGIQVGDVAITKDSEEWDDIGIPALVVQTADDLVCGYHLALLRPRQDKLTGRFLFRCLQAKTIRIHLELAANGVTRFGIPKDEIGKLPLPLPPLPEQRAIADFLDRETARLDALVTEKERWLELLAEKRRALITRAVTRGLNPAAPELRRLKYAATINDEALSEETDPDFELQYVDISNVDSSGRIGQIATYSFDAAPSRARRIVRHGDVIISTVRTYLQAIAAIENPPSNLIVSTGFAVVRPRSGKLDANFCKYAVRESGFLHEVSAQSVGVSYPAINASDLGDIRIPLPQIDEQRIIAAYLNRETAKLDALRAATERTIGLLRERRAALIAAAVTGTLLIPA